MRKHIVRLAAFIGLAVGLSLGQSNPQSLTYPVNMYGQWSGQVFSGNASIGVGSIAVTTSGFFIPGGNRSINPLAKDIPLRIDTEFITPSSISCQLAAQLAISGLSGQGWYCVITGTFSTLHYGGGLVSSGTYGLQEAIDSAQNFGGMVVLDGTWSGNTGMITGAFGFANVSIEDLRGNAPVFYAWNGSAYVAQSGGGGGAVASVFGRAGIVTAQTGDYTVAQITGAAPLASPTFTGTVTLPLTGSAQCLQVNTSGVVSGTGTACGGSGSSPGGSSGNLQYNNGGVFAGVTDLSYATHTLSASASLILDLSAAPVLTGFKLPSAAGASPTSDGVDAFNTTIHAQVWGSNGNTIVGAAAALGNTAATTCSSMVVTAISSVAAPTCTALTGAYLPTPSASTLGGIQSFAAVTHQWINTISTSGVPSASQPTLADLNLGVATQPDNGASPTTAALGVTDNASNALDNTTNWFTDTGSSSVHVSFAARIRGTNQLQVVEQTGPQGQVVIGSAVVPTSINNSPFAKFLILSNTAAHTMERVYQNSTAATGTMVEWNNATVAGSGYNFFKACAGATGNDTGCGSGTVVAKLDGTGALTVASCTGCGITNPMTTLADLIVGGASGAVTRLAGPTTYNGVAQMLTSTATAGVAGAEAWAPGGVVTNAQTGTTYTVVLTDRLKYVSFSNAASVAVTLPQAGATNFDANFAFVTKNLGAGTVTITPTTSTINGSSTLTLTTNQWAFIYSDNTNYFALVNGSGGTVSSIATTAPLGGGTITTSGTLTCTTCVTSAASLTLNALVLGGGSQASKTVAGITTDGTSVLTLGVAGTSVGGVVFNNATSGSITVNPVTGVLGAVTLSLPAASGTFAVSASSPITESAAGALACATCVVASSPGAGIAHFAGSTQTVTSSLIVAADITSATITGTQIASSVALAGSPTTTTQAADDNSTKLATTAYVDRLTARGISFTLGDPTGSALTTSQVAYVTVPFACTISAYNLLVDSGTVTVKFWKIATGTAIPTVANSISTSGVSISSGTAIHSTTVSDFTTTTVSANDIMAMAITTTSGPKLLNATLQCNQ